MVARKEAASQREHDLSDLPRGERFDREDLVLTPTAQKKPQQAAARGPRKSSPPPHHALSCPSAYVFVVKQLGIVVQRVGVFGDPSCCGTL